MAVLLVLVPASLLGLVGADQPILHNTNWLQGLLGASLHLKLADLLRFKVAVLLFNWERGDVGELLAIPVHVSLANFILDLSWDVVAILSRLPAAYYTLGSIAIVFGGLVPLAVKLHGVGACNVVNNLFLHVAIGSLDISALVVILGGHVDLVSGVAHPVLASEASLYLISLLQGLVVDRLHQVAYQLVHIEAHK